MELCTLSHSYSGGKMPKKKQELPVFVVVDMPEWKHKILKVVAALLFIKKANYVMVISEIDTR